MEQMGRCAECLSLSFFIFSSNCIKNKVQFWHQLMSDSLSGILLFETAFIFIFLFILFFWGGKEKQRTRVISSGYDPIFPEALYPFYSLLLVWWWWDWSAYVFKLLMRGWDFWAHGSPRALLLGLIFNQTNGQMINGKRNWWWASARAHKSYFLSVFFCLFFLFFSLLIDGEWNE